MYILQYYDKNVEDRCNVISYAFDDIYIALEKFKQFTADFKSHYEFDDSNEGASFFAAVKDGEIVCKIDIIVQETINSTVARMLWGSEAEEYLRKFEAKKAAGKLEEGIAHRWPGEGEYDSL